MCGIAGCVLSSRGSPQTATDGVLRMMNRMRRRGPDAEGLVSMEGIVLGHRRLAILDLNARSNQPMASVDGRYTIVFNGEIYNFRELRRALEADGVEFHTSSDTEVLLALFAKDGAAMLPRLRGMFALAIWDSLARELFLARDPYGIKPLYYAQTADGVLFASQVKALLASGLVSLQQEPAGLAGFYLWGSVPEPWTLYRDIHALPAGYWLSVRDGVATAPVCWHDIRDHWASSAIPPDENLGAAVRRALIDAVRAHLVADVPVSVFLSGGVDSAVLAAIAIELGAKVQGITVGFTEFKGTSNDEGPAAAATAAHYGLSHFQRRVSHAEFEQDAPRILDAMDQPSIDGINTWFASKAAAERGYKVVLSGVGGDELFCGYPSFTWVPRARALARVVPLSSLRWALLSTVGAYLGERLLHPKFTGLVTFAESLEGAYFLKRGLYLPPELPSLMGPEMAQEGLERLGGSPAGIAPVQAPTSGAAVGLLESTMYLRNQLLRDSDWASMDHSLELRTPFVDVSLLAALGPLVPGFAGGAGKALMAQAPALGLPSAVVKRRKTGFSVPVAAWLADVLGQQKAGRPRQSAKRRSWARDWAKAVLAEATPCA